MLTTGAWTIVTGLGDGLGRGVGDGLGRGPGDGLGRGPVDGLGRGPGDGLGRGLFGQGPAYAGSCAHLLNTASSRALF